TAHTPVSPASSSTQSPPPASEIRPQQEKINYGHCSREMDESASCWRRMLVSIRSFTSLLVYRESLLCWRRMLVSIRSASEDPRTKVKVPSLKHSHCS
ncbi:MAG: hypothetical protein ACPIOQ_35705, partial [Promethearchaeia archaeon]